jgi:hypothetical protein
VLSEFPDVFPDDLPGMCDALKNYQIKLRAKMFCSKRWNPNHLPDPSPTRRSAPAVDPAPFSDGRTLFFLVAIPSRAARWPAAHARSPAAISAGAILFSSRSTRMPRARGRPAAVAAAIGAVAAAIGADAPPLSLSPSPFFSLLFSSNLLFSFFLPLPFFPFSFLSFLLSFPLLPSLFPSPAASPNAAQAVCLPYPGHNMVCFINTTQWPVL